MTFSYLSVFISIVLGIAVVHLLRGLVEFITVQGIKPYWVHSVWMGYFTIWLPYFWWFTLNWEAVEVWTFFPFLFLVGFSMIIFAVTAVLVPERLSDSPDLREYYYRVRRPLFLLMASISALDIVDTFLKGVDNLERLGGISYVVYTSLMVVGHLVGSLTDSSRYHSIWVIIFVGGFLLFVFGGGFAPVF
jgi:hypothetical protein